MTETSRRLLPTKQFKGFESEKFGTVKTSQQKQNFRRSSVFSGPQTLKKANCYRC